MSSLSTSHAAQKTCLQCKSSKKKCDKGLPRCGRCTRLSLKCLNGPTADLEDTGGNDGTNDSRFDEVFRRLEKLEANAFPRNVTTTEASHTQLLSPPGNSEATGSTEKGSENWTLKAAELGSQWMGWMLWGSLLRVLEQTGRTVQSVMERYFKHIHHWLPMISRTRVAKEYQGFGELEPNAGLTMLVLAMHLVVTSPSEHPNSNRNDLSESPWYRACKHHFAQHIGLLEPELGFIQAGILIALFEHSQGVKGRAHTTIGICARMAYTLDFDVTVAEHSLTDPGEVQPRDAEIVRTWWSLTVMDRYINMPPLTVPKQPVVYQIEGLVSSPLMVENCLIEVEASRMLAQVQAFIRIHRREMQTSFNADSVSIMNAINEYMVMLKARHDTTGDWTGIAVTLGAALQLQCFGVEKRGFLDQETKTLILSLIDELKGVVSQCQNMGGFEEDYLDCIQPSYISIMYLTGYAYQMVCSQSEQPVDEGEMTQITQMLRSLDLRYKMAGEAFRALGGVL
ncbi:hypothetical protein EJ04DRAFT_552099 [Polyplosphaeria fusca]|uniref:Zn(2)-C6 fungal-type domain-containing protein n=1 Tax=Polyplosphaeria fusca TaxID=682080 RepID=A0A9P4R203_9PLEO|nr:hypothetical protein EJ04DRAFT_552099 [Polyplosphaeria fusca]